MDTIYTETPGTTCYLDGARGAVTGLNTTTGINARHIGAFISMASGGMRYAELGDLIATCTCGSEPLGLVEHHDRCNLSTGRKTHQEVTAHRLIDRDEFDRLNGLDTLRAELGWAA